MAEIYSHRGIVLPLGFREDLDAYVTKGRPVGDFLRSCIENDLRRAIGFGDDDSLKVLPAVVGYLYNRCPSECWGREGAFMAWLERKRKET